MPAAGKLPDQMILERARDTMKAKGRLAALRLSIRQTTLIPLLLTKTA